MQLKYGYSKCVDREVDYQNTHICSSGYQLEPAVEKAGRNQSGGGRRYRERSVKKKRKL